MQPTKQINLQFWRFICFKHQFTKGLKSLWNNYLRLLECYNCLGVRRMNYQPIFDFTNEVVQLLSQIEYFCGMVSAKTLPLHVSENLRYRARIKSTHYSTAIEGNPLSITQVEGVVVKRRPSESGSQNEQEVRNYWRALNFLNKSKYLKVKISEDFIKRLHQIIEVRGPGKKGKISEYRGPTPPGVLFCIRDSKTGAVEYIPPSWEDVSILMSELIKWINSDEQVLPIPIKAAISAYQLVTIHPFDDGNGRLARAIAHYILMLGGYDLNGYFSVEEYYSKNLGQYYDGLQMGLPVNYYDGRNTPDLTPWIIFFLKTMSESFEAAVKEAHEDAQFLSMEIDKMRTLTTPIFQRYGITAAAVVEQGNKKIDILINYPPNTLLTLIILARLAGELSDVLNKKVELICLPGLFGNTKKYILSKAQWFL